MAARRNRGRWPTPAAGLGVLLLVISVGWLAWVWIHNGAVAASTLAALLGFLLAAALATVRLVGSVRRQRGAAAAPVTAEQLRQATTTLAEVMVEQWAQEATARSLGDPEPMPVRWRLSPTASGTPVMDHPEVIAAVGLTFTGSSDRIIELVAAFRRLDRRRLVITGGPGTGKTTLAVQLLLELLAHPEHGEPVPVFFSLVGWDPQEQPRLQDWLTDRLERDYPALRGFGVDTARALVERGKILPILDGLDEVPATLCPGIIDALNDAALPANSGVILTSRRVEYAKAVVSAGDVLTAAAVIAPLALTRLDAAGYLRKYLPPGPDATWSMVLGRLETGTTADLAAVTSSPLGLWLVRTVYLDGRRDPTPLIENTHPDRSAHPTLQAHLLDQLIPAVLRSRPPTPHRRSAEPHAPLRPCRNYNPDDVRKWLTTLAEELRAARTRDWLWWHLARHTFPTTRTSLTARLMVGLVVWLVGGLLAGLVVNLAVGLVIGLLTEPVAEPVRGLVNGLLAWLGGRPFVGQAGGLAGGLAAGLVFRLTTAPQHTDVRLRGQIPKLLRSLGRGLLVGLVVGLVFGLMGTLVGELMGGRVFGQAFGRLFGEAVGLVFGLAYGLASFVASPSIMQRASSPAGSQRDDRRLTVLVISTVGLAVGLILGALVGLATRLGAGVMVAVTSGLGNGLMLGIASGLVGGLANRAWPAFLVASGWLAVRRRFPRRPMTFLDDAHRLGLLRVVGSAYQFRHAELQDHLAP